MGESSDLDAVVIGDPLGVYCRAWKWGKVKHVVFKERHKERAAATSGGVEQVTLEEALEGHPRVVIAVLGGAKIAATNSLLGAIMKKPSVTFALVDSVDEEPHRDEPELRFERDGWGLRWGRTCTSDWGAA